MNHGWLGQRSVAFWTVAAGVTAVITLIVTLVTFADNGGNSSSKADSKAPTATGASGTAISTATGSAPAQSGGTGTPDSQSVTYFLASQSGTSIDTSTNEIPYFNGYVESASPQEVNGQQFARNLNFGLVCSDTSSKFADYNLGRHFDTFTTTVGLSDISRSAGYQFEIWKDGTRVFVATLHRGQARRLKIPVKGILTLRLGACSVDESVIMEESGGGIFGDPAVTGKARNIPSPASSLRSTHGHTESFNLTGWLKTRPTTSPSSRVGRSSYDVGTDPRCGPRTPPA